MISVCRLSLLFIFIFLTNSSTLNNDLSRISIKNPLTLPSVFVSSLWLLNKSSLIKYTSISYVSLSILLMFKLLTLLKSCCLLVLAQEGSRPPIFKDAG